MKKYLMLFLQLISLFIFIILIMAVFNIIKEIINNSKKGFTYNFGYLVGGFLIITLFFWLNIKLFKFTNRNEKS